MKSIFTFILLLVIATSSSFAQTQLDRYLMSKAKLVVRSGPGANYNEIAEVPKGTSVYVISSGYGEYSTIQYKSMNGFVLTALLQQDTSIAQAEAAAKAAEAKKAAAAAAASKAIADAERAKRAAEEAAKRAIAEAERLQAQAKADADAAAAAAAAANQNISAAERRRRAELAETERALKEANLRASRSGKIANAPIESTTSSYGSNETAKKPSATSTLTREDKYKAWKKKTYKSGATPTAFSKFKGEFNYKLDNYLKINVGKNTDVMVKLVRMGKTEAQDKVVRLIYINSNTTQFIRNIPEGEYYCVIAYGKDWRENGPGKGVFTINPLYEKGQDILDFNTKKTAEGINLPSYSLSLDLLPNGTLGNGNDYQDNITPDMFNKF